MGYLVAKDLKKRQSVVDNNVVESTSYYNSSHVLVTTLDVLTSIDYHGFHGWDMADYWKRVKSGQLMPHTPFSTHAVTGASSGMKTVNGSYTTGNYSIFDHWVLDASDCVTYAANYAGYPGLVQEAASRIYSQGFDALTFLAEITDVRRQFLGAVKTLKSIPIPRDWKKISTTGEWLSARYGWRTLMYDVDDVSKTVAEYNLKRAISSERAGRTYTFKVIKDIPPTDYTHYTIDHVVVDNVTVGQRGMVSAEISVPKVLINPIATAWELIPFSFVADWFVSVGSAIEAASFAALAQQYTASCGYRVDVFRSYNTKFTPKASYISGTHVQSAHATATQRVRNPCSVPFTPQVRTKLNGFKVVDLVALALQRFRR